MSVVIVWLKVAIAFVRRILTPSEIAWRGAANAMFVVWAILILLVFLETFPFLSFENFTGIIVIFAILFAATLVVLLIAWLIRLLKPRYRFALFLALPPAAVFALAAWQQGAAIVVPVLLTGVSLFFGSLAVLWRTSGRVRAGTVIYAVLGAAALAASGYEFLARQPELNPALSNYHLKDQTLAMPNPATPGSFKVTTFTYGSGSDLRRPEYAKAVRLVTHPVDGHKLDTQWTSFGGWLRTRYWGFDAAHMPLQGRVWMPQGDGPFPLALVVHGNHAMEDSSDPGYGYLGELLASQGFILVSVDENFINSSIADYADPFHLRNGDENKVRAWLLLEHLKQWRQWNGDAKNPLHGKVDMDRVALIGHSRGGEAVATANAFNDLGTFPDDATVPFDFHFHLRAIAAIAPVDGQYMPRDWPTPMRDTNYFVIQGAMDGDMFSFDGSSQYQRATFSGTGNAFKSSLYVKGANHDQFNTSWGRNDYRGTPIRYFLDERPIMDGSQQRQILKVYLAAFLRATLKGEDGYRPLFEDPSAGAAWLPDDYFIANYADSRTSWLANYKEDIDPATGSDPDIAISGDNLSVWREDYPDLKFNHFWSPLVYVAWDDRVHKGHPSYRFQFRVPRAVAPGSDFVFSVSQADIDTLPKEVKTDGPRRVSDKALDWTIVVTDAAGNSASVPLSKDQLLFPQLKSETRRAGLIDFIPRSEFVLRRYRFSFGAFREANRDLDLSRIKEIRFAFDRSTRGAIALDDVGIDDEATK